LYFPNSAKGYKYGLIVADLYSLYISFYPMRTKNSSEVAKCLRSYFAAHCPPCAIYSDNDASFRGDVEELLRPYNIKHITSYPYTQRQNYVESQVRTFKNAYRAAIMDNALFKCKDWDILYPIVICRINSMISKYGMSREAVHYGSIVESSLPLITDSNIFEPLENDLEKASNLFKERMGRFMQKRKRNKIYYKVGKKHNFYINELVMYKNFVPDSMLDATFVGPARIIDLSPSGATVRDTKTGVVSSINFEHLRKINFEELLTLLPQNFDAEIAETLGTYRYRRAADTAEKVADTAEKVADNAGKPESEPENETAEFKKTRSGKVYKVDVKTLPAKYAETVTACTVRAVLVPKVVPEPDAKPAYPILKRRCKINFLHHENEVEEIHFDGKWSDEAIDRVFNYEIDIVRSILRSDKNCVKEFTLNGNKPPGRVKFGKVTAYFY
jgi:hypothetical protein